jgi:CheY-like chemotaxis protein
MPPTIRAPRPTRHRATAGRGTPTAASRPAARVVHARCSRECARTVLIADDEEDIRGLVALTLARGALTVVQAGDGDEALLLARCLRPDLALLDVLMPGLDGIEVCRTLKADPATAAMPVVVLTAEAVPDVRERARAAGADAYLTKPFSPAGLLELVRQLLPP